MPVNKPYRQGQILTLVRSRSIYTQEELAQELNSLGIPATQVTLSRDIRELGLAKTPNGYRQIAPQTGGPALAALASEFVLDLRTAQNLVVIRTSPGNANTVAVALDKEQWPEVVGTLAGDDTILVVSADNATAAAFRVKFLRLISAE